MNQPLDFAPFIRSKQLRLRVVPNAKRTLLKEENGMLKLYLKAPPEKGKANKELLEFFRKEYRLAVRLVAGERGRQKVLEIG